jgi:hypothetical protein
MTHFIALFTQSSLICCLWQTCEPQRNVQFFAREYSDLFTTEGFHCDVTRVKFLCIHTRCTVHAESKTLKTLRMYGFCFQSNSLWYLVKAIAGCGIRLRDICKYYKIIDSVRQRVFKRVLNATSNSTFSIIRVFVCVWIFWCQHSECSSGNLRGRQLVCDVGR